MNPANARSRLRAADRSLSTGSSTSSRFCRWRRRHRGRADARPSSRRRRRPRMARRAPTLEDLARRGSRSSTRKRARRALAAAAAGLGGRFARSLGERSRATSCGSTATARSACAPGDGRLDLTSPSCSGRRRSPSAPVEASRRPSRPGGGVARWPPGRALARLGATSSATPRCSRSIPRGGTGSTFAIGRRSRTTFSHRCAPLIDALACGPLARVLHVLEPGPAVLLGELALSVGRRRTARRVARETRRLPGR